MSERTIKVIVKNFVDLSDGRKGPINVPFPITPTALLKEMKATPAARFGLNYTFDKDLTQADVQVYIDADKKSTEVKVEEPAKPVFVPKAPDTKPADTKPADTKGTEGKAPVATDAKSGQPASTTIVK